MWGGLQQLGPEEIALCQGPSLEVHEFCIANLNGIKLGCEHVEANTKAVNSIVLVKRGTDDERCG